MRTLVLPHHPVDWVRFTARTVSAVWAGFWMFFSVGSTIAESQPPLGFIRYVTPAALFCAIVAWAWRHERSGGIALMAAAAGAFWLFDLQRRPYTVWLAMAVPPLLAGALFLLRSRSKPR